jgi:hypothetical protein
MSDNPKPYEWKETEVTVRALPRSAELNFDEAVVVSWTDLESEVGSITDKFYESSITEAAAAAASESSNSFSEHYEGDCQVAGDRTQRHLKGDAAEEGSILSGYERVGEEIGASPGSENTTVDDEATHDQHGSRTIDSGHWVPLKQDSNSGHMVMCPA